MTILISLYGLLIGSFLNVCIYRIPREESIVFPSSHCPNCGTKLLWHDLVPVFSYLVLRGNCRYCGEKISPQYPIVELLNSLIYTLTYWKFGLSFSFLYYAVIFSILIVIAFIDLNEMIIPDILIILILTVTVLYRLLLFLLYSKSFDLLNSIGGLVLSSFLFILIILISKGGMGGGDVTLIGSLGFILGIKKILLTIFSAFIFGAIISIILLVTKIREKKDPIPFGPFIILGFFITVFWGDELINWYLSLFF